MSRGIFTFFREFTSETLRFIKAYIRYAKRGYQDATFRELRNMLYLVDRKNCILRYYEKYPMDSSKYYHELRCLEKGVPYLMTCDVEDFINRKSAIEDEMKTVAFDSEAGMYFVLRNTRKLYFKKSINSIDKVKEYYEYLAYEQTEKSPHRYLDKNFDIDEGSIVVDCGAAEGIFGLDNIDKIKLLYIFECDKEWIEALQFTFKPYKDKVQVIDKYVGNEDNDSMVKLDTFFNDRRIDFLKMDIEGCETDVLCGAQRILSNQCPLKIVTAAYHSKDAEKEIRERLTNFKISTSEGFLLHGWEVAEPPYFRTGIIRAEKENV